MNKLFKITISLVILFSIFTRTPANPARAASELVVTNANSGGTGSLFQAILDAASGDTIIFDPAVSGQTISWPGTFTGLVIDKNIKIDATSVGSSITIAGNRSRIFKVSQGSTLEISGVTITNDTASNYNPSGGDIWNEGNLILSNCSFLNSSVGAFGGAIYNQGNLTITNCMFSRNKAVEGGAIYSSRGIIEINNSTFIYNNGGIRITDGRAMITNSTFFENSINSNGQLTLKNITTRTGILTAGGNDISGTNTSELHIFNSIIEECRISSVPIFTNSNNLILSGTCGSSALSSDPLLGVPTNNGGSTQTMILFPGSPAIDAGENATCVTTDQRGIARPQGSTCDIGAFEVSPDPVPVQAIMRRANANPTDDQSVAYTVIFSEAVTGVDTSDFRISTVTLPDAYIETVRGSGYLYTVTANTGSGNGDFRIWMIDDDSIINTNGDALGGTGTNSYYYSSDSYTVNKSEINLTGNDISIADGNTTPSVDDHTDFGGTDITGGTVVRTFVIENNGSAELKLTGVPTIRILGTHASNFSVATSPISPIAANETTSFTILFDPSAIGPRTAMIRIFNDDVDESSYDFNIQGTGLGPEISLTGNNISIADGDTTPSATDHTDFGNTPTSNGVASHVFTIFNTGNTNLNLTGTPLVSVTGTHSSDFIVTNQPSNPVLPGESTTFTIDFDPSANGLRTASISIGNNDSNESPYNFSIQGTGTSSPEFEIRGNNEIIIDDDITPSSTDHTDFSNAEITGNAISHTFTIYNLGDGNLTLTGSPSKVLVSGANASDFTVSTQPTSPISPGGSTTFTITFVPSAVGVHTATVSINNNDSNENPYNFSIQGAGLDSIIFTVNTITDDNDGFCDVFVADASDCTLREALALASNGDTINFHSSLAGQTIRLQSTLTIDKSISIDASALSEKVILSGDSDNDGDGDILILNILASQVVTIKNIEFTKGYTPNTSNAGAIANLGNLSIYNSEFNSNQGGQGGAIRNSGQLLIENSSFTSSTSNGGGAILNNPGAVLSIKASAFSNNQANTMNLIPGAGGAIVNLGNAEIFNSFFTDNFASYEGGGIVNGTAGLLTISGSTFTGNSTNGNGGAIKNIMGTVVITDNSQFNGNSAMGSGGGGAISNSAQLTINDSSFSDNQADFGGGGAVANTSSGTIYIMNSSISANASVYGAGIFNEGNATVTNTEITTNSATQGGGGIINGYGSDPKGTLSFSNGTISGNSAPYGGGVFNLSNNGSVTLANCSITGNTATNSTSGHGGGVSNFVEITINNCTIANNSAPHYGGGIFSAGTLTVNNSTISNNSALNSGGIEFYGDLSLKNTIIANSLIGKDCFNSGGTLTQNINNLIENNAVSPNQCGMPNLTSDPNLGSLANNGGSTQTMALLTNSPAINAGDDSTCETADQRGVARPQGVHCDIGAFEYQDLANPLITSITRVGTSPISASSVDFTLTFSESVQNVDVNNFSLTTTGVTGASITGVTPISASVYTISVNTGSGNGTIRLDVPDTASIKDLSNNDLSGLPFTSGEVYTIEKSTPLPTGWVGSVSVTSDKSLVSVGRPHIGSEVASYDGFASGSTNAFVPMLFKDAFGGDYDAALYIQNVSGSSASVTLEFYDTSGSLNCTKSDSIAALASKGYWLPSVSCTSGSLPSGWVGGVKVSSDQPIVAVGRPHIGSEVMTYNGFSSGSTSAFIPMLFKDAFGGSYDSAFYIQNVGTSSASVTIQYFDNSGSLNCTKSDSIASFASKGYWLPSATCDSGSLPTGWVGGVKVSSDQPIVTVGRPHIGSQITTYDGFSAGSSASFVPMLFKGAFGGSYDSAFYLQNTGASSASVTIEYYDNSGSLNCTKSDAIAPLASKGYWLPSATCDTGSLPAGWVGGVKVSSDQPVVAVGRPHIGSQITTYNGFPSGAVSAFLPMLFKDAFGGEYDSAFYLQNTEASEASVTIQFFDNTGTLTCSRTDTIQPKATLGFWVPSVTCFP